MPVPRGSYSPLLPAAMIQRSAQLDTPQNPHSPTALAHNRRQQTCGRRRPRRPTPVLAQNRVPRAVQPCNSSAYCASVARPASPQLLRSPRYSVRSLLQLQPPSLPEPPARRVLCTGPDPGAALPHAHCASPLRLGAPQMIAASPRGNWQRR